MRPLHLSLRYQLVRRSVTPAEQSPPPPSACFAATCKNSPFLSGITTSLFKSVFKCGILIFAYVEFTDGEFMPVPEITGLYCISMKFTASCSAIPSAVFGLDRRTSNLCRYSNDNYQNSEEQKGNGLSGNACIPAIYAVIC